MRKRTQIAIRVRSTSRLAARTLFVVLASLVAAGATAAPGGAGEGPPFESQPVRYEFTWRDASGRPLATTSITVAPLPADRTGLERVRDAAQAVVDAAEAAFAVREVPGIKTVEIKKAGLVLAVLEIAGAAPDERLQKFWGAFGHEFGMSVAIAAFGLPLATLTAPEFVLYTAATWAIASLTGDAFEQGYRVSAALAEAVSLLHSFLALAFTETGDDMTALAHALETYLARGEVDVSPGLQRSMVEIINNLPPLQASLQTAKWMTALKAEFGQAERLISPLVFDLDGDGVELVSLSESGVRFDLDADGFAESVGWIGREDGFLAIDRNRDGIINDIGELFGDSQTSGFARLSSLDSNHDGLVNALDASFQELSIWRDANANGYSDAGEILSVTQQGIAEIDLHVRATVRRQAGNLITEESTFTRADGSRSAVADVWFAVDDTFSTLQQTSTYAPRYVLNPESLLQPQLRGYGVVPDLDIAMSLDPELLKLLRQFSKEPLAPRDVIARVETIIFRWTGAYAVSPSSRGPYIDARRLAALEALVGRSFASNGLQRVNPGQNSARALEHAWRMLAGNLAARLLAQRLGPGSYLRTYVDIVTDTINLTLSSADACAYVDRSAPQGPDAILYWTIGYWTLQAADPGIDAPGSAMNAACSARLAARGLDLGALNAVVIGGDADDRLSGTASDNYVVGGGGNDTLAGGAGNDRYVFGPGFGSDVIEESGGIDTIAFTTGIAPGDVLMQVAGSDLRLRINGTADQIRIAGQFLSEKFYRDRWVEFVEFADGTVWSLTGGLTLTGDPAANTLVGTAGNDVLRGDGGADIMSGDWGNDVLSGDGGDDTLRGGPGDDQYVFAPGFGSDVIEESGGGIDTIAFTTGIAPGDVLMQVAGSDLRLRINGTTDQIRIAGQFLPEKFYRDYWVEFIRFADGTVWSLTGGLTLTGDAAANTLVGTEGNDVLRGDGGADILSGDWGSDVLSGDGGDDTLRGGPGDDQYVFAPGFGSDVIEEKNGGLDAVVFTAGIAPNDVLMQVVGSDLRLRINGTADQIRIAGQFLPEKYYRDYWVESVRFADGTVWSLTGGLTLTGDAAANTLVGTAGNDVLRGDGGADILSGDWGSDVLSGDGGDDTLRGGPGDDQYVFAPGFGSDVIEERSGGIDTIVFTAGIAPNDVLMQVVGSDLRLRINGTTDQIRIVGQLLSQTFYSDYWVEFVRFADGTVWNLGSTQ